MPSTAQPAPETGEKKSRGLGSYVVWAFVAVMVYVLSAGPVERMAWRRPIPQRQQRVLYWVYAPFWFAYNKTPLHRPLGMYLHLWSPMYKSDGDRLFFVY